jgi:hypothetical protein
VTARRRKGTDHDWRETLRAPAEARPEKPTRRRKGSPATTPAAPPEKPVAVGTYVPASALASLRILAAKLSAEHGRRVTIRELVTSAIIDLLRRYEAER